jgi:NitT/TauT family transport system ATP-binding protein
MSKIHIEGLSKTYASSNGRVAALENVSIAIEPNEFVTLVGPSGCGKSTLLKVIGALIRPTRGTLLYDGGPLLRPTRDVGIVFQEAVLLQWRNVLDNVLLPTEILGLDKRKSRARAMDLINLVGLGGFERRYPRELSGGMQQRVSICRALIHNPSVLLMDEPFAAHDARGARLRADADLGRRQEDRDIRDAQHQRGHPARRSGGGDDAAAWPHRARRRHRSAAAAHHRDGVHGTVQIVLGSGPRGDLSR